jgi:hypothetical protein
MAHPWLTNPWVWGSIFVVLIAITVGVPILLLRKNEKMRNATYIVIDRLTTLSGLYLFLDAVGIVVIIIRNITG